MFVQEEKIFAGKVLRLHICASDGTEWLEEATEDTSVEQLKERCLKQVRPARPRPPARRPFPSPPSRVTSTVRRRGDRDTGARGGEAPRGRPGVPALCLLVWGRFPGSRQLPELARNARGRPGWGEGVVRPSPQGRPLGAASGWLARPRGPGAAAGAT